MVRRRNFDSALTQETIKNRILGASKTAEIPTSPSHALYKRYFPKGGGSIFTFEVKGGADEARAFIDRLQVFSLLANVADAKSLVIHPASTTHGQLTEAELAETGILPNTVRLSIGIEHVDDIIEDLDEAFKAISE